MSIDPWIAAAIVVAAALVVRSRFVGGRKVSSETVRQKITGGAVILDVRTADEYRGGAYPGAINIPVQELAARLGELPKGRPIVVYCASGIRSAAAAAALARAGFTGVVNAGGLRNMPG